MCFSKRLKELKLAYGETQRDLANAIEVGRTTISEYESGKIIYIDNNDIPELYMVNKNSDGLDILYWIDDNDNLNFMEIRFRRTTYGKRKPII